MFSQVFVTGMLYSGKQTDATVIESHSSFVSLSPIGWKWAGGKHPTGMHPCFLKFLVYLENWIKEIGFYNGNWILSPRTNSVKYQLVSHIYFVCCYFFQHVLFTLVAAKVVQITLSAGSRDVFYIRSTIVFEFYSMRVKIL